MKLKTKVISQLYTALLALNGRNRIIETDGKATGSAYEPFAFPVQTRLNIARNITILRPLQETYEEARKALVKELSPDGTTQALDASPLQFAKYQERHDALLEAKLEVKGLLLINWTDLEPNKVMPTVISDLAFLVRGLPKHDDADLVPESAGES